MAYCTNCGKPMGEQARYCANCGKKIVVDEPQRLDSTIDTAKNDVKVAKQFHIPWGTGFLLLLLIFFLLFWKKGPSGTYYDEGDGDSYIFKDGYLSYGSIYVGWTEGREPYHYSFGSVYGINRYGEEYEMARYSFLLDEVEMGGTTLKKYK